MAEYQELISDFTGDDEAPVEINEIGVGGERVALIYKEKYAPIIDRAVNACISLNKENPLAAAEGMKGLYGACEEFMISRSMYDPCYQTMIKALASIERGK